jgi:putative Mg2+ transporter-C (MgtC) family protein
MSPGSDISTLELLLRLGLAALLGYLIGLERQFRGQPAGDRTHALAALGAAAYTLLSLYAFPGSDPARVAAQVVIGLGFLAGGVVIRDTSQGMIHGLTTAAGIWAVGAMGLAIGVGWYAFGLVIAALIFLILIAERLLHIDERITRWRNRNDHNN